MVGPDISPDEVPVQNPCARPVVTHEKDCARPVLTCVPGQYQRTASTKPVLRQEYTCTRPVEAALPYNSALLIIPQGSLCFVPWPALMNAHGTYLLENHTIRFQLPPFF
eukprot:3862788-Rhodomonas_salina.1